MIELILAAALLQTPDPCHAADAAARPSGCPTWQFVSRYEQGSLYIDLGSARLSGDRIAVDLRVVFLRAYPDGTRSVILRHRFDCRRRTVTELSTASYDARGVQLNDTPTTGVDAAPADYDPQSPTGMAIEGLCRARASR